MHRSILTAVLCLATSTVVFAEGHGTLQLSSGVGKVALLELYTSEGCSSCPPADRWLSTLKKDLHLWSEIVPIALHVDYWNYIGWVDPFSRSEHTSRQRNYQRSGAARAVYTPGFFSAGEEWVGWFDDELPTNYGAPVGNLSLNLVSDKVAVQFEPVNGPYADLEVSVAILGMQLQTEVRAGENKGKMLSHDFVALEIQTIPMNLAAGKYAAVTYLGDVDAATDSLALIAWVSTQDDQAPLQAVGGYLHSSTKN